MSFFTRNILSFYELNQKNLWYLKKHFASNSIPGLYQPEANDPFNLTWQDPKPSSATVDYDNTYKINSLGLRGEIYNNPEILASGCSLTFGLGVPELGRWTNIFGSKINKDVMNLANPGATAKTICINIIQYCMNNKMPKEIFCLMPDFFRSMVIVDKEFYKSKTIMRDIGTKDQLDYAFCLAEVKQDKESIFMRVEDQKYIEDSTSPHQLILDSINFIYILESFCLSNNIKLYWTTWDLATSRILGELVKFKDFKLKNFTPILPSTQLLGLNAYANKECNSDHGSEFRSHKSWPIGTDYTLKNNKKQKDWAHIGIHAQYHVADFFYNLYKQENPNI